MLFLGAIVLSYYHYIYTKNYDYLVEAECNPDTEECLFRDCENVPDNCPPNGFSNYKEYSIKAYDFSKCEDGTCKRECEEGVIECEDVKDNATLHAI